MSLLPIVYAFPCRWDDTPARQRYLMEAVSAHTRVFFLNWPRFSGSRLQILKPATHQVAPNVWAIDDAFGVRFARGAKRLGRLGAMLDSAWIHSELRRHGVADYVYWLSAVSPRMLWSMNTGRLVYDCIDPCFDAKYQAAFDRDEHIVASQAKVVFATAEVLRERLAKTHPHTYLLPNACSEAEYDPAELAQLPRPAALANRKGPVIGYMGTFDWRVDVETLAAAAKAIPEYTFALPGRINPDQEHRVAALRGLPNIILPGSVSVAEGRAYVAAFDVGLIPFLPGDMGDAINPVKMHMYLMAGKPVVTTWLRECRRYAPHVTATQSVDAFVAAIRAAASDRSPEAVAARVAFARTNSWRQRAADAVAHLTRHGLLDSNEPRPVSPLLAPAGSPT